MGMIGWRSSLIIYILAAVTMWNTGCTPEHLTHTHFACRSALATVFSLTRQALRSYVISLQAPRYRLNLLSLRHCTRASMYCRRGEYSAMLLKGYSTEHASNDWEGALRFKL